MGKSVTELLNNQGDNYIFPFFWQHGEDEKTLREYMRVIEESNCHAVCVESRPHPDFCGDKWWQDMDVILDEARKRNMKVWILDDSHFPTGYANGAVINAPLHLRRQSVYSRSFSVHGKKSFSCNIEKVMKKLPKTFMGSVMEKINKNNQYQFEDQHVIGVSAMIPNQKSPVAVPYQMNGGRLQAEIPENAKKVYVTFLTRNAGIHRSYINMLEEESCRILIDAVYEPHWEHYKEDFGKTIAGFFSDEPEIGNGVYFHTEITMGHDFDFPWSASLESALKEKLGENWVNLLPLLWENEGVDQDLTAYVRYIYMDTVTRLVERCFSKQIGNWCQERGVKYIGHMIEDNNQHARLGASLGHYFRGLSGQHMAGIDDIGGQVLPQKEDAPAEGQAKITGGRDGEFYHYLLGKLGASAAAIDPKKDGNCMCEIFGNYGWSEGPRLEKYLADHFMVQGINHFVPHAFSAKTYPDPDCPPHFYANGHNPGYRHFGQVIAYMNRICNLISGGRAVVDTAILYHGEAEWTGKAMLTQKPARILMEHQVDFHVLPADVFAERERYQTVISQEGLKVNGNCYHTLLVPYAEYITEEFAAALPKLKESGCKVLFLDKLPKGIADTKEAFHMTSVESCPLNDILDQVDREIMIEPESFRIRALHYKGAEELYYFVNENDQMYEGKVKIPRTENLYCYNAWNNQVERVAYQSNDQWTEIRLSLKPGESAVYVSGICEHLKEKVLQKGTCVMLNKNWKRSICSSVDYPNFKKEKAIQEFGDYGKEDKKFSGFIAYETVVAKEVGVGAKRVILEITDAGEDVEVFVNGASAGIQVLPPFHYDITEFFTEGENTIRIEVATTLERERGVQKKNWKPIGIIGTVNLYVE